MHLAATQDTHTHADEVAGEIFLLPLTHPGVLVLPKGSQEQWAAFFSAPGAAANVCVLVCICVSCFVCH